MNLVPIQITIQAANASDLRALVADLAGTIATMSPANIPAETTVSTVEAQTAVVASKPKKEAAQKAAEAAATEEAEKREAATEEAEKREAAREDIPSDVALRELAAAKAKSAGKPVVKALLDKYNSASITAVPQESRIAFKADLEAL